MIARPIMRRGSGGRQIVASNDRVIFDNYTITTLAAGSSQLSNHGPDVGNAYFQHPLYTVRNILMDSSGPGRLYPSGTTGTGQYLALPKPPHADQDVSCWIDRVTVSASEFPGVVGRFDAVANTGLIARYDGTTDSVVLIELTAGVATQTITQAVTAWVLSSQHKMTLRMRGNQISVLVDDVQVIAPTTVAITTNNYAGVRLGAGAGSGASTGFHVRKFEVLDFGNKSAFPGSEPAPDHPATVRRKAINEKLNGRNELNGVAFIQSNLVTFNGYQYAVWVNAARKPIIGRRLLPDGDWQNQFDLSTVAGNPLDTATLEDAHNTYAIGIGSDGRIHVCGNMHDVALNYVRSTNAEDLSAWVTTGSPTTGLTSQITYTQFLRLPNGNLLLFTRNGVSGNGDMRVAKYTAATQTWSSNTIFIDGNVSSESPYINRPAVAPDGTVHLFYCWRASAGGGNDNQDICHIKSLDQGTTWKDMAGNTITLPVTHATSPLIVDTAVSGSGLLNQAGSAVDTNGRPHAAFFLYDGSSFTQVQHIWHNGSTWVNDTVTSWSYHHDLTVGVVDAVVARPQVFCPNDGTTWLLLRHNVNKAGRYYAVDVTPGRSTGADKVIWRSPTYYHEATIDDRALVERDEVHMFMTPSAPVDGANTDMTAVNWQSVNGWVATVKVSDLQYLPST